MAQYVPKLGAVHSSAPALKEPVELFISCRDIIKKDLMSKSDPFVVVYIRNSKTRKFTQIGRTEVIYDNHYPSFSRQFRLDYYFEQEQILRFDVYDEDKKNSLNLQHHDYIGSCTMILGEIVHETGMIFAKKLICRGKEVKNKKTKKFTHLIATLEKVNTANNKLITLQISCKGLPKMDGLFGKADPYFIISRVREDHKRVIVYGNREKKIKKTLHPTFPPFQIETQTLCNNDEYRPIIIALWDWDRDGSDDYIGEIQTSLNELKKKPKDVQIIKKYKKKNKIKKRGKLSILRYESTDLSSFLDFMQGTVDMSLMVAIDFTGSNGDPRDTWSLHNIYGNKPSPYQHAIRSIGNILSSYDSDQLYPVWGFGANFNNVLVDNKEYWNGTKHAFNLNFNLSNPEVSNIIGIENVYLNALKSNVFALSGPTLFGPILRKASIIAQNAHNSTMKDKVNNSIQYFILLIITDGIITDMKNTKNEIVSMANKYLPISIIIIGVGNADFNKMEELDGDDNGLMNSKCIYSKRDIVQFVAMNKSGNNSRLLAKETLYEIPMQFLSYVRKWDILPGKKIIPQTNIIDNKFIITQQTTIIDDVKDNNNNTMVSAPITKQSSKWDNAPLPIGWERAYDENGHVYYVDNNTHTTSWNHPSASSVPSVPTQ